MERIEAESIVSEILGRYGDHASNRNFGNVLDWHVVYADIKELGLCNLTSKVITINAKYASTAPSKAVLDTIRHECAHALAGIELSRTGRRMAHGRMWKKWARIVGANDRATSKTTEDLGEYGETVVADRVKKTPKWVVVVDRGDMLEKVSEAGRRMKDLDKKIVKGDRSTRGKLWMVESRHWKAYKGDRDTLTRYKLLVR